MLLLTIVRWRIGLMVVPPKSCMLQRIVIENRGIIIIMVCTQIIRSFLLSLSS